MAGPGRDRLRRLAARRHARRRRAQGAGRRLGGAASIRAGPLPRTFSPWSSAAKYPRGRPHGPQLGRGWIFCARSLRKTPSGLKYRAPKSRGLICEPSTSAYGGRHTARTGRPAPDFKPEARFRSERGQKFQPRSRIARDAKRACSFLPRAVNRRRPPSHV